MDRALQCRRGSGEDSHGPQVLDNWIVMAQDTTDFVATSAVMPQHRPTARNCPDNSFAHNDLRAVRIRGVCPRGLIEARRWRPARGGAGGASAGSAPAASLKLDTRQPLLDTRQPASAGSAPAASLKRRGDRPRDRRDPGIRGVCPRGLIEATRNPTASAARQHASAGSAPAASLKLHRVVRADGDAGGIRGVCPRGLIEARSCRCSRHPCSGHPRGLPPRPH